MTRDEFITQRWKSYPQWREEFDRQAFGRVVAIEGEILRLTQSGEDLHVPKVQGGEHPILGPALSPDHIRIGDSILFMNPSSGDRWSLSLGAKSLDRLAALVFSFFRLGQYVQNCGNFLFPEGI